MKIKFEISFDTDTKQWRVDSWDESVMLKHSGSSYYRIKFADRAEDYQIGTIGATGTAIDEFGAQSIKYLSFAMNPDEIDEQLKPTKQNRYYVNRDAMLEVLRTQQNYGYCWGKSYDEVHAFFSRKKEEIEYNEFYKLLRTCMIDKSHDLANKGLCHVLDWARKNKRMLTRK